MNVSTLHEVQKAVDSRKFFKGENGELSSIQLLKGAELKKHTSPIPAVLICVSGKVKYSTEKGTETEMESGDYVDIEPWVLHWINGLEDAQLILAK